MKYILSSSVFHIHANNAFAQTFNVGYVQHSLQRKKQLVFSVIVTFLRQIQKRARVLIFASVHILSYVITKMHS